MMMTAQRDLKFDEWELAVQEGEYEEAFAAMEAIVAVLETGSLRLADAVKCFEFGTRLARKCERILNEAELRITVLSSDPEGSEEAVALPEFGQSDE